ncbi:MAG TPA: hypothetical protein VFJ62_21235 [Usitatibacter sp.]|nr:hypothetical protein [Usitatibacter sp.]
METKANDAASRRQLLGAVASIGFTVGTALSHPRLATAMISLTLAFVAMRIVVAIREHRATRQGATASAGRRQAEIDRLESFLRVLNGAVAAFAGIAGATQ